MSVIGERSASSPSACSLARGYGTWCNIRHATTIDGDVAFKPFPILWQDAGTGVFALAAVTTLLLATVHRYEPGRRTLKIAGVAAGAAFLMDVYTW